MCDSYCKFQNIPLFGLILHNLFNHMVALLNQLTSDRTLDVFAENPIYASVSGRKCFLSYNLDIGSHPLRAYRTCPDVFWNSHCFLAFVCLAAYKNVFCILYVPEIKFLCQTSLDLSTALEQDKQGWIQNSTEDLPTRRTLDEDNKFRQKLVEQCKSLAQLREDGYTKQDEFSGKFLTAFEPPPPSFSENYMV